MRSENRCGYVRIMAWIAVMMLAVALSPARHATAFGDIGKSPHAETILRWKYEGLANGFEDGTFRPDSPISRAETVALINRAFQLEDGSSIGFSDVSSSAWYRRDVEIAVKIGYIKGFTDNTFRPLAPVTREQLAVIIQRILNLPDSDAYTRYADAGQMPKWSRGAIGALADKGIASDSSDKFRPTDIATRAEVVAMLDQARALLPDSLAVRYTRAGEYGPVRGAHVIEGDVEIRADGVVLQNIEIRGNLTIDGAVSMTEGTRLKNVTVHGRLAVDVPSSLALNDSRANELVIDADAPAGGDAYTHVNLFGDSAVNRVSLHAGAWLSRMGDVRDEQQAATSGTGFGQVVVEADYPSSHVSRLSGNVGTVEVRASAGSLELEEGQAGEVRIRDGSRFTVTVGSRAAVNAVYSNDPYYTLKGNGMIRQVFMDGDPLDLPGNPWEKAGGILRLTGGGASYDPETFINAWAKRTGGPQMPIIPGQSSGSQNVPTTGPDSQPQGNPVQPTQPSQQPAQPTQLSQPSQQPAQPTQPSQPSQQPTQPSQQPAQPTQPSQPSQQEQPSQQPSQQPTQPAGGSDALYHPDTLPDELTEQERELANLINAYRRSLNLPEFKISKSLTRVARYHVYDSNANHPKNQVDARGIQGNLHSWSDKGPWRPVVYTSDHMYAELLWSKPSELTAYTGSGYEISAWSSAGITPIQALVLWQNSAGHNAILTGEGVWSDLTVMGVGIYGQYAHVWFGEEPDPAGYYE